MGDKFPEIKNKTFKLAKKAPMISIFNHNNCLFNKHHGTSNSAKTRRNNGIHQINFTANDNLKVRLRSFEPTINERKKEKKNSTP